MSTANELKAQFQEVVNQYEQEARILVRSLQIRNVHCEENISKKGRPIKYVAWEYYNPDQADWGWKQRKTPLFTPQANVIIKSGPYYPSQLYSVTAEKGDDGFYEWVRIEKAVDSFFETETGGE